MKKIIGFYRKCDLLTMCGTLFSFIGIILIFNQHYTLSVVCMVLSGICDAFDGTLARKGKYSKMEQAYGVQLDSLSDVICFGVFPAILTSVISNHIITKIICAFYMLCGVIRLAYFNTLSVTEENKKGGFVGVPITTVSIVYPLIFFTLRFLKYELISTLMPVVLLLLGISFILKIHIPKVNVASKFDKILNKYILNLILFPLFIILSSDLFYKLCNNTIIESIKSTLLTIPNNFLVIILLMLIINLLFVVLLCITKKSNRAQLIILIVSVILMVISDIKFNIMGIPLEISDINYLNPANMSMMGTASGSIGTWIISVIIKATIVVIIGLVFIHIFKNKTIYIKSIKIRISMVILAIISLTLIFTINNKNSKFIIEKLYKISNEQLLTFNAISEVYDKFGFYQGMYINTLYDDKNTPENYDKTYVKKLLDNSVAEDKSWGKANVVFILSEAFSNLENINEIKFDKELISNIKLYENSENKMVFDLLVPVYGGASVNTEFEILTGASLSLWRSGFIPYTQYYNTFNGKHTPNLINEFNNNGYETMYLTPWAETSYKSQFVYNMFGTDKTIYNLSGEKKGMYLSDKSLIEAIYEELAETKIGKYKFIMSASAQNHFPYDKDLYKNYDIEVIQTNYNNEDTKILQNYAQGIYDADKELNNLYEKIQTLDVPTIIVFFGDHLPYTLNSKGTDPYTKSTYFNTENNNINLLRKYTTKAVILSNYDIETEDLEYINASYLGAYVLNKMDLEISNYFKYIDNTREILPVFNRNTIYKNNMTYDITAVDETTLNALNNYKYIQYGSFYEYIK